MPITPFIYGVVVGAVVTYIIKDDPSRKMLKDTSDKVTDGIGSLSGKVTSIFKKDEEAAAADADKDKDGSAAA